MIKEEDTQKQVDQKSSKTEEAGDLNKNKQELISSQLSAKIEEMARNLALNDASEEYSSSSNSMFKLPKTVKMKVGIFLKKPFLKSNLCWYLRWDYH